MLENRPGVKNMEKLRSILPMEANLKVLNKLFIGVWMTKMKEKAKAIIMY